MGEETPELPEKVDFRCLKCGRMQSGSGEELHREIEDLSLWPHCCNARMAIVLPVDE